MEREGLPILALTRADSASHHLSSPHPRRAWRRSSIIDRRKLILDLGTPFLQLLRRPLPSIQIITKPQLKLPADLVRLWEGTVTVIISRLPSMNYILFYSLSLLLYQSLYTVEQHRIRHYLAQLAKSGGFDIQHNHGTDRPRAIAA